ncbi:MIP/aquaporin family protein [Entomospira culicis]|uniref:Aquaporin family protein n=1 Tax=Entomospira culicis TaxID=2719989 RepID=A0A968L0D0_9SPIO|nr:MIP/aquaporin family protein [Entomospira culicis]NIZ20010.1 aquaporin family protein [Entomospira culicis]NIZ70221.1 aquaporin family protein [Entomospira culicis]WDI38103.1 aquaporin family protein [Entomospira culicis]WDI39725.1 aquaporin family protein [Entomospira culicis]
MTNIMLGEFLGTAIILLFGNGTNAANTLNKSFAKGTGWVFIAFGWGLGVFAGIVVSNPLSGAHLNPAVSLAMLMQQAISLPEFVIYFGAQLMGAIFGSWLVYQLYYDHFTASLENKSLGGVFFTNAASANTMRNLLSEVVGTFILVLFILNTAHDTSASSLFVPFLIVGIGIALGSLTGYAINPVRDLGPRLMYTFTRLSGHCKDTNWSYAWIPIIGPLLGAGLATLVYQFMVTLL